MEAIEHHISKLKNVQLQHRVYAHRDYKHTVSLWDSLLLGVYFLELDVHLINGRIYVCHDRPFFYTKKETLEDTYLKPLFRIFQQEDIIIQNGDVPLYLMLDIKSHAGKMYQHLKGILPKYKPMLSYWSGQKQQGAVEIILSGNRPLQKIESEKERLVFMDGRLEDIGMHFPTDLMPIISDTYLKVCDTYLGLKWGARLNKKKLEYAVGNAHAQGKKIRFYQHAEDEKLWSALLDAGVDLINTDRIGKLIRF